VTASADASTGALTFTAADGRDVDLGNSSATAGALAEIGVTPDVAGKPAAAANYTSTGYIPAGTTVTTAPSEIATINGKITLSSATSFSLSNSTNGTALADAGLDPNAGTATGSVDGQAPAASTAYSATLNTLSSVDLSTVTGANSALGIIDAAISQVDSQRAVLGATSNRFQATVSNLQQTSANLSSSRARIEDTDYAAETANLSQAQILQQAGTAMLTQANSLPNSVLTLLKG
jgi:flagellin